MEFVQVIDISRHQGRADFRRMRAAGVSKLIVRIAHGDTIDDRAAGYYRDAVAAGFDRRDILWYVFVNPKRCSFDSMVSACVRAIRDITGGTDTALMWDCEKFEYEPGSRGPGVLRGASYATYMRAAMAELAAVAPDMRQFAYSNAAFWDSWVGPAGDDIVAALDWIVPRYPVHSTAGYQRYPLPGPAGWADWAFARASGPRSPRGVEWDGWQFSADFNGQGPVYGFQSSGLDLNIVKADAWPRWTGRTTVAPDPAPQPPAVVPAPDPDPAVRPDILRAGESLLRNESIENGNTVLVHQLDGNVVLYVAKRAVWSSGTHGKATTALAMQADGNLVLYNGNTPVWSTGTHGRTNGALVVQPGRAFLLGDRFDITWEATKQPSPAAPSPAPAKRATTVRDGEGFWQIAKRVYGRHDMWDDIAAINGGKDRVLHPGDTVRLPA